MKIFVTGAHGLLGSEFVSAGGSRGLDVVGLGRAEMDVLDAVHVSSCVAAEAPDWVVHCAAYTAVDRAEEEPELAMSVNRDGARNVARAAAAAGARMVYISTDYVFDGEKRVPYLPSDPVAPLSEYGRTKLAGEKAVAEELSPLIARTGWLYGSAGPNFVTSMLRLADRGEPLRIVEDQCGRPTWARNVASVVLDLMRADVTGLWHVADGDDGSWLDLAREAFRIRGIEIETSGVTTDEWGAAARRPTYSVLDVSGTESAVGRSMTDWRPALSEFLSGVEDE